MGALFHCFSSSLIFCSILLCFLLCCSVAQSCLSLCNPMNCGISGFLVLHCLPEFAQTRVHWVDDAIQPSQPLLPPSPPAVNLSQHQGLFQWVGSSHQIGQSIGASASASVLPMNIQGWFPLGWTGWISLMSKGLWRVFSQLLGFLVSNASSRYYLTLGLCTPDCSVVFFWAVMCVDATTAQAWHASGLQ